MTALSAGGGFHTHSEHEEHVVLEAKQSLTSGHGQSCLPKKHLAFPFPLTTQRRILISSLVSTGGFCLCVFVFF